METTTVYKVVRLMNSQRFSYAAGLWDIAPPIVGLSQEWARFWRGDSAAERVDPPDGSVIADRLRITKRVWPEG